jgi:hypothetical protein
MGKSKKEHSEQNRVLIFSIVEQGFDTVRTLIKWGAICYIAYQIKLGVEILAGKSTTASFILAYLTAEEHDNSKLWFILAVLAGLWAFLERKLRHNKVRYLSARVGELEKKLDLGRSSSELAPTGQTHPRDDFQ